MQLSECTTSQAKLIQTTVSVNKDQTFSDFTCNYGLDIGISDEGNSQTLIRSNTGSGSPCKNKTLNTDSVVWILDDYTCVIAVNEHADP